jgi:LPXTG-motif cell wall-anchored protein
VVTPPVVFVVQKVPTFEAVSAVLPVVPVAVPPAAVTATSPVSEMSLAHTGTAIDSLMLLALAALILGGSLVVSSRRAVSDTEVRG